MQVLTLKHNTKVHKTNQYKPGRGGGRGHGRGCCSGHGSGHSSERGAVLTNDATTEHVDVDQSLPLVGSIRD